MDLIPGPKPACPPWEGPLWYADFSRRQFENILSKSRIPELNELVEDASDYTLRRTGPAYQKFNTGDFNSRGHRRRKVR